MQKIFLTLITFVFLTAATSSCKKCYTCAYYGTAGYIYCEKNTPKAELQSLDTSCTQSGGVWTVYAR